MRGRQGEFTLACIRTSQLTHAYPYPGLGLGRLNFCGICPRTCRTKPLEGKDFQNPGQPLHAPNVGQKREEQRWLDPKISWSRGSASTRALRVSRNKGWPLGFLGVHRECERTAGVCSVRNGIIKVHFQNMQSRNGQAHVTFTGTVSPSLLQKIHNPAVPSHAYT